MKKFTDEELSRILGHVDAGLLDMCHYSTPEGSNCVLGAADCAGGMQTFSHEDRERSRVYFNTMAEEVNSEVARHPDRILHALEKLGLA